MSIKTVPAYFKTMDGREFDSEIDAQNYQKILEAIEGFEQARYTLETAIATAHKTADGHHQNSFLVQNGLFRLHELTPKFEQFINQVSIPKEAFIGLVPEAALDLGRLKPGLSASRQIKIVGKVKGARRK